jgi:hypothetical protein
MILTMRFVPSSKFTAIKLRNYYHCRGRIYSPCSSATGRINSPLQPLNGSEAPDWERLGHRPIMLKTKPDDHKGNHMQAIEFEAQLNEGIIYLPRAYRHWHEGKK